MASRDESAINRAFGRASADIDRPGVDKQHDIARLLEQVAEVRRTRLGTEDDTMFLLLGGAHNAGFEIAVAISAAGQVGWSLA